jgi:hypothetical protein
MPLRTASGGLTKLGHFEQQVKGTMPDSEMYAIANKQRLMHGNKATARGARASSTAGNPIARGARKR